MGRKEGGGGRDGVGDRGGDGRGGGQEGRRSHGMGGGGGGEEEKGRTERSTHLIAPESSMFLVTFHS